ncbi:hypothetical protein ACU4GD_30965 [Cupriavidus basilensis]
MMLRTIEFKKLVDGVITGLMKSGEIKVIYDKWFNKPIPPKNINFEFPMSAEVRKAYEQPGDDAFE